jgi:hypothetical protein
MRQLSLTHVLPVRPLRLLCSFVAVALLACTQGEGETCQNNRDCDDGLVCVETAGSDRSVCRSPEDIELDAGDVDAAEPELPDEDAGDEPDRPDASDDAGGAPVDAGDAAVDAGEQPVDEDAGG